MTDADVVVLGAGPGGLGAGIWCASLGLKTVVFEASEALGGQLHRIALPIPNLPGLPGVSGASLVSTLSAQARDAGVELRAGCGAELDPTELRVRLSRPTEAEAQGIAPRAVILATGVRRRTLDVPGEQDFCERGVWYNVGARAGDFSGASVVVVGGGDDAFEHAALLAEHARGVTLVHRTDRFHARASLQAPTRALAKVTIRAFTRVLAVTGDTSVRELRLLTPEGEERLAAEAVFVCIGPVARTGDWRLSMTPDGYLRTDRLQRTSRAGVWAVGDVCTPEAPTIATALGQGAVAAKSILDRVRPEARQATPGQRPPGDFDRLRIAGISLPARIGVYPREKKRRQTLNFDVEFDVDAQAAAPMDLLRDTIDYASVVTLLEGLLGQRHYNLIETVAEVVASALLTNFVLRQVRVRVTKPGVPQHHASASVEVLRTRYQV